MKAEDRRYTMRAEHAVAIHHARRTGRTEELLALLDATGRFDEVPAQLDEHAWHPQLSAITGGLRNNSIGHLHDMSVAVHAVCGEDPAMATVIDEAIGDMIGYNRLSTVDMMVLRMLIGTDYEIDGDDGVVTVALVPGAEAAPPELVVTMPLGRMRLRKDGIDGVPDVAQEMREHCIGKPLAGVVAHPMLDVHDITIASWEGSTIGFAAGTTRQVLPVARTFGQGEASGI